SGGGGGPPFGEPGDAPESIPEEERAQKIIDIIVESVEPEAWSENGGEIATIRFYQGVLIIRAPDYIHREIGGYPFAPQATRSSAAATVESRYVTFNAPISIIENVKFRPVTVTGAAGGGGFGGGNGGNPAPPAGGPSGGGAGSPPSKPSSPAPPARGPAGGAK
ncbi:MAG: hypothetical protein SGJ09_15675, partial [Phycisphaerae bacterium]|nr:hypothetical protein [Phycisphaerae bacterium]